MLRALTLALLCAAPAFADAWQRLTGSRIETALSARVLQYEDGATQNFFADGRTLYAVSTGESWGKWWVAQDQYCSTWPPSETPACYTVEAMGPQVRFIATGGDLTVGRYADP